MVLAVPGQIVGRNLVCVKRLLAAGAPQTAAAFTALPALELLHDAGVELDAHEGNGVTAPLAQLMSVKPAT